MAHEPNHLAQGLWWRLCVLLLCLITSVLARDDPAVDIAKQADKTSIGPEPTPSTIVDILSSEVEFSYFLRILQKTEMIPVINSLQNVTLLAPVNLAFANHELNHISHDELYRYIVDQRFRIGYMSKKPTIFNTLYEQDETPYPILVSPNFDTLQYEIDHIASVVESDIYAKHQWSFIQAIDSQLPVKPGICDVLLEEDSTLNGHNISFVKGLFKLLFQNQVDLVSDEDVDTERNKYKDIPTNCQTYMANFSTVFIPTDDMIRSSMSNMTMRYYSALYHTFKGSKFSITDKAILEIKYDITKLLNNLLVSELVGPANITQKSYKSKDTTNKYHIESGENGDILTLNGEISSSASGSNLVYADGVIHVFDKQHNINFFDALNIEPTTINPRKALYALHYSSFVSELEFRSLGHLIDGTSENQTILLSYDQRDDISEDISMIKPRESDVEIDSFSLKQRLLYQFINESFNVTDMLSQELSDSLYKLVDSALCSKSKIAGCYKLKVSSSYSHGLLIESRINDDIKIVSEPFDIGNGSIAYFVNKAVETPRSLKHNLADLLSNGRLERHLEHILINQQECLKTIQYLNHFDLLNLKDNDMGYSIFLPCGIPDNQFPLWGSAGGAWKSLGLLLNHFEKHPKVFKNIMKGLFVEGTFYSDFGLSDSRQFIEARTLRGDSVNITNEFFDGDYNHLLKINLSLIPLPLNSDLLFNKGVVHVIGNLLFPNDFEISFTDLIRATEDNEQLLSFLDLIKEYPQLNKLLTLSADALEFSLFIPTQESLNTYNITKHADDLLELLEFHLLPNSELPKLFDCLHSSFNTSDFTINSNSSQMSFTCKKDSKDKAILSINKADGEKTGHKLKILNQGCTRSVNSTHHGPCVFLIDKPIRPKWLYNDDGFLHVHLGIISVMLGIILGLILFSVLIMLIMFFLGGRGKKTLPLDINGTGPFNNNKNSSFMGLGVGEDSGNVFDRGYETDDDMQNERERLLPHRTLGAPSPKPGRNYGSTAPLSIRGPQSNKALNRSRNLPGV